MDYKECKRMLNDEKIEYKSYDCSKQINYRTVNGEYYIFYSTTGTICYSRNDKEYCKNTNLKGFDNFLRLIRQGGQK